MMELQPDTIIRQCAGHCVVYALRPEIWGAVDTVTVAGYRPKTASGLTVTLVPSRERVQLANGHVVDVNALQISGGIEGARYQVTVNDLSFQVKVIGQ